MPKNSCYIAATSMEIEDNQLSICYGHPISYDIITSLEVAFYHNIIYNKSHGYLAYGILLLYTFINGNVTTCWYHTAIHDVIVYYHHYYYYMDNNYFRYDVLSSTLHLWLSMHICTVMNCQVTLQDDFTIRYEHSSSDTYIDWISSFPSYEHEHSQLFTPNMNLIHLHCRIWNHEYISRRWWTLIYLHIYTPTTGMFHKLHLFADYWTVSRTILHDVSTSFRRS